MPAAIEQFSRKFIGAVEDEWQLYSNDHTDYAVGLPIGFGASSVVYAAQYQPSDGAAHIPCALKVLDLDRLPPSALRLLQNETQLMSLSKHPNVLRVRGTWVEGHKLYIAMRLMNAGSVADVMRYSWSGGLEEEVIRCILRQALEGLNYFHINGLIHRDVKAANLLIDEDGTVLLGDLGVAAFLWDSEGTQPTKSRTINFDSGRHARTVSAPLPPQRPVILGKRKSFVGTPCWMAPEVIKGKQYDASADIWSFGITALELAQGRAPRSRMDPHQVLLSTVRDDPPRLERTGGQHKYSSAFADVVAKCLNKDASRRPTATELLQMPFFKGARKPSYLCSAILRGLPALTKRQERRKQPSIHTHATLDSWDFSSSMPSSPTASIMRRSQSFLPQESVFEMDGEVSDAPAPSRDPGNSGTDGDDEGDHAGIDGHSQAEAYAVRIRARHRNSSGRNFQSHSRSGSHQSVHSVTSHHRSHSHPHSHARHLSHDDPRSAVRSIQEVVGTTFEESSESEPEDEGIPISISPKRTGPKAPETTHKPSTSPVPSTHSSTSAVSSKSSPSVPSTPLSSSHNSTSKATNKLWRKLAAKLDVVSDTERDPASATPPPSARKRSFGAVLGRTALVGADMVRTASRTMSSSKQIR